MAVGAAMVTVIAGCSPQQSTSQASNQAPSGGGPVVSAGSNCEVDVKRVCQELRNKPVVDSETGLTYDTTEVEQNAPRTVEEFTSLQIPNGALVQVECEMNTLHHSVVYAHLMPSPPLTATDVAYLESSGYCAH
jgi:hypothetical protein